jgi:hypothetical protein
MNKEHEKFCFTCNTIKYRSEFNVQKRAKDGLQSRCKSCFSEYRALNKERSREYIISYREENKSLIYKKNTAYKEKNKEILSVKNKSYNSQKSTKERKALTHKIKMESDLNYRLSFNVKRYIRTSIKKHIKRQGGVCVGLKNINKLSYTPIELKQHLESLFRPGMSWDNYGFYGWHIDHIKPLCLFDLTDEQQLKEAWSLSNLQPLWAKENLIKNKKYEI